MATEDSRKLSDLRVVDLRSELERRDLDKSGNKQALLERLQKAMESEGLDPETHVFDTDKKPVKRLSTTSSQPEGDTNHKEDEDDESENTGKKEEGIEKPLITEAENNKDEDVKLKEESNQPEEKKVATENTATADSIKINDDVEKLNDEVIKTSSAAVKGVENGTLEQEDKKITTEAEDSGAKEVPVTGEKTEENQTEEDVVTVSSSSIKSPFTFAKKMSENRNLWITNISQNTRATELKQILAAHGKVIGAKVVINAKYPGACCYGYVTMETVQDAENCIAKLNNTELNGQIICVEKVRPDHMIAAKMSPKIKPDDDRSGPINVDKNENSEKENAEKKDDNQIQTDGTEKKSTTEEKEKEAAKKRRSSVSKRSRHSNRRSRSSENRKGKDSKSRSETKDNSILTFDKIKEERERQRLREKERLLREENRRRHKEATRQREVDRLQRIEATRLERERAKLRLEREKLEKDKADIIRLERERQKLEREKLELEKLELERVRLRLQEEDRRATKRPSGHTYRREEAYDDRKRPRPYEDAAHFVASRETKDAHYGERSPHYRRDDRDRRAMPAEPARNSARDHRYPQGKVVESQRFDRNNTGVNTWSGHPGAPPSKVFNPNSGSGSMKSWGSNRWPVSNTMRSVPSAGFSVNVAMPMAPAPSAGAINTFVGGDRFDFKAMSSIRKY